MSRGKGLASPNESSPSSGAESRRLVYMRSGLDRHGLPVAIRHFDQMERAFAAGEWESANAQMRSFREALFDDVAAIRLKSSHRGGAARKELADKGVLVPWQSGFIKSFMDLAGEKGSHAGLSDRDEALARRHGGLAVAFLTLSLLPDTDRVEEVLAHALTAPPGGQLPSADEIETECPTCGQPQDLGEARVYRDGEETVYEYKNDCQPIVTVGLPGDSPWPGRGYRLGEHVIRNAKALHIPVRGKMGITVPASPAALMKK